MIQNLYSKDNNFHDPLRIEPFKCIVWAWKDGNVLPSEAATQRCP